ncbi:hypothetical protein QZH41_008756, partial [Actinostola sp. cb2023]
MELNPNSARHGQFPMHYKPTVEEEYDRLEREGIIERIEYSEWGTPMVHIPKSDGKTRSCGDYSVTPEPIPKGSTVPSSPPRGCLQKACWRQTFQQHQQHLANLHRKIHDFLLTYRSSPNATTGVTPAKLLLGREVKTRLSLVLPNLASDVQNKQTKMKEYHDVHAKYREFTPGQTILAKDHRSTQAWQPATVTERRAPYSYSVELPDGRVWNRHVDHLLKGATQTATSAMKDQPTS